MLESTVKHMQSTVDKLLLSIMDTSFDQEKQKSHIKVDELLFDYSDKDNQVERFIKTFRDSKAESDEILFKNLLEILKQCSDYPNPRAQNILLTRSTLCWLKLMPTKYYLSWMLVITHRLRCQVFLLGLLENDALTD